MYICIYVQYILPVLLLVLVLRVYKTVQSAFTLQDVDIRTHDRYVCISARYPLSYASFIPLALISGSLL